MKKFSIIIPVYSNAPTLVELYNQCVKNAKKKRGVSFEYVFVDDGSEDESLMILESIASRDKKVKVVKMSRNFGAFVACLAGLSHCSGDCASIIAADLQDPPELLLEMYDKWIEGFQVVMAAREKREENFFKIFFANIYYALVRKFSLRSMPNGGFDFVLIDRKVIDVLVSMNEKNSSLMGQILWAGFHSTIIYYTKRKRKIGKSKWTLRKKIKYFIDTFVAFSDFPIRFISVLGIVTSFAGFVFALNVVYTKVFIGIPVPGFTLLLVIILISSGIQMLMLGILGEYLWRNFDETRKRPIFIVDQLIGFEKKNKTK